MSSSSIDLAIPYNIFFAAIQENDPAKACNSNGAADISALKELPEVVMAKLMREKYTMEDARQQRQPREFANTIIRNAKSAELHSAFDQMLVI
ncbi:hypothetical protein MMC22_006032 [Lobaria immixta]|nr:hypothetical protein [Lobaria immixta]